MDHVCACRCVARRGKETVKEKTAKLALQDRIGANPSAEPPSGHFRVEWSATLAESAQGKWLILAVPTGPYMGPHVYRVAAAKEPRAPDAPPRDLLIFSETQSRDAWCAALAAMPYARVRSVTIYGWIAPAQAVLFVRSIGAGKAG